MRKLNKKFLALLLVAVLAVGTVMSAWASSGTGDDTDITTGFSAHTGEVTISGDFTLTYTFTNTSTGTSNWENFILEMHNDDYVYVDVRADNYGWLANQTDESDYLVFGDGSSDWDAWNAAMAAGSDCVVVVEKSGADLTITITAASETFTATAYVAEYEDADLTVYLTGENVSLTDVAYSYTQLTDDVEITTGFSARTGEVTLSGDFVLTYTFTNTSTGTSNWENFILEMHNDDYVYVDVRADNYGWLANQTDESDYIIFGDGSADWDTWNAAMAAGSECTVTVEKAGASIVITVVAGGETFTATAYVAEYEDADITVYLTGENVTLTNVSYTYDPDDALVVEEETSSEDETTTTAAAEDETITTTAAEDETTTTAAAEDETTTTAAAEEEVEAEDETTTTVADDSKTDESGTVKVQTGTTTVTTEVEETISEGTDSDLTITTAFSAHTGEVTLTADEGAVTLTYTFYNVSNGSLNYENFILEMHNDDYVYLDVRADNYGWLANQTEDDTIEFGEGLSEDDWAIWNAAMAAGSECTVVIVRDGADISVTVTAGDQTFTTTAYVSEFADADLTVYLTGEACTISDVSYVITHTVEKTSEEPVYSEVEYAGTVAIQSAEILSTNTDAERVIVEVMTEDEIAELDFNEGTLASVYEVYLLDANGDVYTLQDGEKVQIKFIVDGTYEGVTILHYNTETGFWELIDPDEVGENYIIATFTSLSPVAIVYGSTSTDDGETTTVADDETTTVAEDETTATDTDSNSSSGGKSAGMGDITTWMYFALLAGAAAVCVVLAKKRVTE